MDALFGAAVCWFLIGWLIGRWAARRDWRETMRQARVAPEVQAVDPPTAHELPLKSALAIRAHIEACGQRGTVPVSGRGECVDCGGTPWTGHDGDCKYQACPWPIAAAFLPGPRIASARPSALLSRAESERLYYLVLGDRGSL